VFSSLKGEDYLRHLSKEQFAASAAHYLSEINAIQPFREGNGRVQRLFMSQLAENAGYSLSYVALGRTEMYSAMEAAFFGDEKPLATLMFEISGSQ
jgi:cell filamentation protein